MAAYFIALETIRPIEIHSTNVTAKLEPIWNQALALVTGKPTGWAKQDRFAAFTPLVGLSTKEAARMCIRAGGVIRDNLETYKLLESPDGLGTAEVAANVLLRLGKVWIENPGALLRVVRQ